MSKHIILFITSILFFGCNNEKVFKIINHNKTGVNFINTVVESDRLNILDYLYFYNGGGVSLGDINDDDLLDIFFTANQGSNKLFLNNGNLKFTEITETAGVSGNSSWSTGSVMVDINNDGLLDIYVCSVVGINGFTGSNELYINNGDNTFTEKSAEYGLDFKTYSSAAAFLDYDLDGDLDMYLLNHSIHTPESFGNVNLRYKRDFMTGDKLLKNDNGKFIDVSEEAGIFSGVNGYGLGISIADFNNDTYPDIYIGNDFHEDDYYYINNGNGTFTESLREFFDYSSRFSMGNDNADINGDGFPEIISLDMLPQDEKILKSSQGDFDFQIQNLVNKQFGYHYQFSRNMLFKNNKDKMFSEIGILSGVSATDWSWSSLFSDYDQDGNIDLFISNGIPRRPNNLDFIKFVSSDEIRKKINNTRLVDQEALNLMPEGYANNYFFKGNDNFIFQDKSNEWVNQKETVSGASAYGDLDNDGDLDLVVNNFNDYASIYVNTTDQSNNYLKVKLDYKDGNVFGIGTKVFAFYNSKTSYRELYTARGFQSSSEPIVHFGFGKTKLIDSLKILWPNNTVSLLKNLDVNQTLKVGSNNSIPNQLSDIKSLSSKIFQKISNIDLGINFKHVEDNYNDFLRQKLIPFKFSDRGPSISVGDLNNDGDDDIFIGGSKFKKPKIFLRKDKFFIEDEISNIYNDSIYEDISSVIADFNNDGLNDLIVGSGGGDYFNKMSQLNNRFYIGNQDVLIRTELYDSFENNSIIIESDYDLDGDLDIFVGNHMITNDYGQIPQSYILDNIDGELRLSKNNKIGNIGMVTDAVWSDYNNDGFEDLIIVGEWMEPVFLKNINGKLSIDKKNSIDLSGLWQSIIPFDIDNDGDLDYVIGNWGENSKFKASYDKPMKMYYNDFDKNGITETIIVINKNGEYYTIENLDNLTSQIEILKKKFNSYESFAGKKIDEIFSSSQISSSKEFYVNELKSGYLINEDSEFKFIPFDSRLQVSPILSMISYDFDNDNVDELLLGGNYFGVTPYHGRLSAMNSFLIESDSQIKDASNLGLNFLGKSVRDFKIINIVDKKFLITIINDEDLEIYKLLNYD